ncbi:MAG TPA: SET domain-containing protein-lysine N-methyltransferase [Spirochaetota bacterium]|nr:SET domain-containing protein-lysine N-methyltransferase [Spirochaetota bacterium]
MEEGLISSGERLAIGQTGRGRSVFALEDFGAGSCIIEFGGGRFSRNEYISHVDPDNNHFLQIDRNLFLGPTETADNFINHSCDPNCGLKIEAGRAYLFAIRQIAAGDEITFDYSTSMDEDFWEMRCQCSSAACRGRVRDFKHLPVETRNRYITMGAVPEFILSGLGNEAAVAGMIVETRPNALFPSADGEEQAALRAS